MNIVRVGSAVLLGAMLAACASPQEQKQSLQEAALAEGFTPVSAAELTGLFADAVSYTHLTLPTKA